MSYKYILENTPADISTLSEKELRSRVRELADVANKRMKRYEQAEQAGRASYSHAYERAVQSGGRFSTKGKNTNDLRAEYKRVYKYLTAETSTRRGARVVERRTQERLGLSKDTDMRAYWERYAHAKSNYPQLFELFGSETLQQRLVEWEQSGQGSLDEFLENEMYEVGSDDDYDPDVFDLI